jgi:hypothetical protein
MNDPNTARNTNSTAMTNEPKSFSIIVSPVLVLYQTIGRAVKPHRGNYFYAIVFCINYEVLVPMDDVYLTKPGLFATCGSFDFLSLSPKYLCSFTIAGRPIMVQSQVP